MKKTILSVLIGVTLFACMKEEEATRTAQTQSQEEYLEKNKLNIPAKDQLKTITPSQKKLVQDWLEFTAIHENMKLINGSTRFSIIEDLGQLASNIETLQTKKFPEGFDVMQIRSRLLVLKTKALKLQDDATDDSVTNETIEKEIVEMNKAFAAILYQIEQTTARDMKPEEILGDVYKTADSIAAAEKVKLEKENKPTPKATKEEVPKKPFQEVDPENQ
ncbi:hypothetical protein C8N46_107146 [Kordia periserrulae]|uniref:Lipoprotein n=1 Tax=Kordia periserrulae TaxID=701523 RepID=A0A2T6BVM9_9FLAO|nr:hypothetical protein [Kordia periserrulae]PTX60140.1 hypothetical protein C8N46_107146 [Kordia periserrulae]